MGDGRGKEKAPGNPDFRLALWIGAAVLVGIAIMIGIDWPEQASAPPPSTAGAMREIPQAPAASAPVEDPRAAADQLFNRAMTAHETGQQQQASFLLPEAIAGYQRLEPLDGDGLFHLALLQLAVGDPSAARASADRILAVAPDHLLGLAAAAEASEQRAPNEAKQLWQRYLDAYDAQQGQLPEYAHHEQLFPILNRRANEFIAGPGASAMLPGQAAKPPAP